MLRCARCTFPLKQITHQGAIADYCTRCGSVFLERGEASVALAPEADPEVWVRSKIATPLGASKLRCPKDQTLLTAYKVSFGSAAVEVDVCGTCRGLWLDNLEAPKLRFIAEEAKRTAEGGGAELRAPAAGLAAPLAPALAPVEQISQPGVASYFFQLFTGLPIEVHNPLKRRPVVVYALLASITVFFILQMIAMAQSSAALAFDGWWLVPQQVLNGERIYTLITSMFMHGSILHLAGNAYFLWTFGDNVEDQLGKDRFVILYFVSGIAAGLLHCAFNSQSAEPCLGASGAIAGLLGAYMSMFPQTKVWVVLFFVRFRIGVLWYLGFWVGIQVLSAMADVKGVAWYAHIGGFIAGVVLAPFLRKRH